MHPAVQHLAAAPRIVVGVTGGIAAYKTISLVRQLVLAGYDTHVVLTRASLSFVGQTTWQAISRNPVHVEVFEDSYSVEHVALGKSADLIVVAPATANSMAKFAGGLADDMLGNVLLASAAPVIVAPAMHTEMWEHPATQANVGTLAARGVEILGPASGQLTGADVGAGRMVEPEEIFLTIERKLAPKPLAGKRVLVTAGGTREPLDPVRFIGNRSSGRQGVEIAKAAWMLGGEVKLIACNITEAVDAPVTVVDVGSTAQLSAALDEATRDADIIVMAAAVADYRPADTADSKLKKESLGEAVKLELVRNPDLLRGISRNARPGQVVIGFAAETKKDDAALLELGRAKLERKGCDYLVINRVGWELGFGNKGNAITIIDRAGAIVNETSGTKSETAYAILNALV